MNLKVKFVKIANMQIGSLIGAITKKIDGEKEVVINQSE